MNKKDENKYHELTEKIIKIATPAQKHSWNHVREEIWWVCDHLRDISYRPSIDKSPSCSQIKELVQILEGVLEVMPMLFKNERHFEGRQKEMKDD